MKAVVTDAITTYPKTGVVWELSDELKQLVQEVENTGEPKTLEDRLKFVKVLKKDGIIVIEHYYLTTISVLLTEEYIKQKYSDILEFISKNQPVRRKDLEKEFRFRAEWFIKDAKALGLIKSTNKGHVLVKEVSE